MGYSVQVTKCYLVQVLDDDGNEVACNYSFGQTKKEAERIGTQMVKSVQKRDEELCKCGYSDCIFNTPKYKSICDGCIDGSEYDDEEN